jgi:hypothetical protein
MSDRRKQIPIGCAVNVAIINELSKNDAFTKACIEVPLKFGIKPPVENAPWPFFNISWGAYMMYSLFVVSKELYNLNKDDDYFQKLVDGNVMSDFLILKERNTFNDNPLYHFTSFRNAISHVNYTIDNNKIKLWDHPHRKPEPENWHWEVEITNQEFMIFLGKVNERNFEFYNDINSGIRDENGIKV